MLESITSQPFLVSLLLCAAFMFFVYSALGAIKVKPLDRLLILIPVFLALGVIYMQNGPLMATVLMSAGFLLSFGLAFGLLAGPRKQNGGK